MFEKEAKKWVENNLHSTEEDYIKAFKDGAEFGYNKGKAETALLSQHILDLQKDKGNLTDKVRELEQRIEKMKLCANCKHCGVSGWCHKLNRYLLDKANQCCGNWEMKEE